MEVCKLNSGEGIEPENEQNGILAVYVAQGSAWCENQPLEEGTMISSEEAGKLSLRAEGADGCRLICVRVQL